jgi:hypothetical protein
MLNLVLVEVWLLLVLDSGVLCQPPLEVARRVVLWVVVVGLLVLLFPLRLPLLPPLEVMHHRLLLE